MPFAVYRPGQGDPPPLIVVDLGFSAANPSCGFRAPGEGPALSLQFGEMCLAVCQQLAECRGAVLVLEAPLSGCYQANGNPIRRGDFEGGHDGQPAKYWYCNAGAMVALAAQRLLSRLAAEPQLENQEVLLAEAFLTREVPLTGHDAVAQAIYEHFHAVAPQPTQEGAVPLHSGVPEAPLVWVFTLENLGLAG